MSFLGGNKSFSDEEIVEVLRHEHKRENEILKYLYLSHRTKVHKYLLSKGADAEDIEDLFQESLITFYEQVKSGKFVLKAKIATYLKTVARNKWINLQRDLRKGVTEPLDSVLGLGTNDGIEEVIYSKEAVELANALMNQLKPDCRKVLESSIYRNMTMKDIAEEMGYKNEQIARNKKHKCLEKLKLIIRTPNTKTSNDE